jgi:hypothetical protein
MNRRASFVAALLLFSFSAWAQMAPKPGPEVKKLDYFVGTWTSEGTVAPGPWGAGGKFTSTDASEWMPGNFFVVTHSEYKMPAEVGGDGKEMSVMGYDTQQNTYIDDDFNSEGEHELWKGTVSGDAWTWTGEANYGGQDIKQKLTFKILSPTSYSTKLETSLDGTNWLTFMEGKATKK